MTNANENSFGQNKQRTNDSIFQEVSSLINARDGDSLYTLLNDDFKSKFRKDAFTGFLKDNLYPLGKMKEYSFIDRKEGISSYKIVYAKATLEFSMEVDEDGKISSLRFLPYKEPVATKSFAAATNNPMKTTLDTDVDHIATQYINKANTVGLCIGILKNGTTAIYGYGATAKENNHIPDSEAIFEIGSITKTFTAVLLAYYVGQNKLSLSDPITKYLPDSVAANKNLQAITLQMLSNHTSGLARIPDNMQYADLLNPYKNYNRQQLFTYLKDCKLQSVPGEKYAYSNLGAGLLGVILENASGQTYEQMVSSVICKPLAMSNTFQHANKPQKERLVSVYNATGEPVIMWDMDALAGAGGLKSTMHDMLLYAEENMTDDKTDLSNAFALTHKITYDKEMSVGLGWHKVKTDNMDCYWHNGGTGGSSSYIGFVPDKKIAVIVLSNAVESVDVLAGNILKILD